MKECFSASELSKILDISARAIRNRANKEKWKFINGKRRTYPFQGLPKDIRRKIVSQKIGRALDFIPSKNINISHAEAGLKRWNKAAQYNRKIAQARDYILSRLSEFTETKSLNQGQGEERFVSFYNANLIKDIAPWVLDKISTVSMPRGLLLIVIQTDFPL